MLTQLKLSNFRIFDDSVTVRFRPITIFIGKNNAGKSSVIKFLLMLQQSINVGSQSFLAPKGIKTNLGKFYEMKNQTSQKKHLTFILKTKENSSPGYSVMKYVEGQDNIDIEENSNISYEISAEIPYKTSGFRGESKMVTLVGDKELFSLSMKVTDNSRFLTFRDILQRQPQETKEDTRRNAAQGQCCDRAAEQIKSIQHIRPVKKRGHRSFEIQESESVDSVGKDGKNALPLLRRIRQSEDQSRYEFIRPHLENVLGVKEVIFDEDNGWAKCIATNKKTGAKVNIANFGFGVSQCLPIFVQGALMNRYSTLMVEQPQAQVHPTAQLELGKFFADLWTQRKVCSVIETHSANIILRLRHLIAKGDYPLTPDDVSIAFFDIEDGKAIIKNLDVDEDGVLPGLPMRFFGADIEEALEMGAEKYRKQAQANVK